MQTVLDLLKKFDALNKAKSRKRGKLSKKDQERWEELKVVYDLLLFHSGLGDSAFTLDEIKGSLADANQLRVPVEADAMVHYGGDSFEASVVNLSRSGVFLATDRLVPEGERLTLYLAGMSADDSGDMLELDGEVVWCAEQGVAEARVRRGMGVRLVDLSDAAKKRLEALVVQTIERRIAALG